VGDYRYLFGHINVLAPHMSLLIEYRIIRKVRLCLLVVLLCFYQLNAVTYFYSLFTLCDVSTYSICWTLILSLCNWIYYSAYTFASLMNNCTMTILSCVRIQWKRRIGGLLNSELMTNECVLRRYSTIWYD